MVLSRCAMLPQVTLHRLPLGKVSLMNLHGDLGRKAAIERGLRSLGDLLLDRGEVSGGRTAVPQLQRTPKRDRRLRPPAQIAADRHVPITCQNGSGVSTLCEDTKFL